MCQKLTLQTAPPVPFVSLWLGCTTLYIYCTSVQYLLSALLLLSLDSWTTGGLEGGCSLSEDGGVVYIGVMGYILVSIGVMENLLALLLILYLKRGLKKVISPEDK